MGYWPKTDVGSILTSDGDILTRIGGVPARITRAALAADSAFSDLYSGGGGGIGDVATTDSDVSPGGTPWSFVKVDLTTDSDDFLPTVKAVKGYVDGLSTLVSSDPTVLGVTTVGGVTILDVSALSGGGVVSDAVFRIADNTTPTKQAAFEASGLPVGTSTFVLPAVDGEVIVDRGTQTFLGVKTAGAGFTVVPYTLGTGFGVGAINSMVTDGRNIPFEFKGNSGTGQSPSMLFLHDGSAGVVGSSFAQTAINRTIISIGARGHIGTLNTSLGYSAANALRIQGITDEAVSSSVKGAHWVFWSTMAGSNTITAAFQTTTADHASQPGLQSNGSLKTIHPTLGIGYGTGAGGAVTQLTSKSTGVTLNTVCGQITTHNASLATNTTASFTLTNSAIAATDVIYVCVASGSAGAGYSCFVDAVAAGSCRINVRNITGSTTTDSLVLTFVVIKAVIA